MKRRPIGIWLVAVFGVLITLNMAQNVIEAPLGSPTGIAEYLSTGFALAGSIPLLIAAFVFSVLVIRMDRHAIWGWATMVLAIFWPVAMFAVNTGMPDRADADTVDIGLRYGPLLFWAVLLGLIGVYLYHARKTGVLKCPQLPASLRIIVPKISRRRLKTS